MNVSEANVHFSRIERAQRRFHLDGIVGVHQPEAIGHAQHVAIALAARQTPSARPSTTLAVFRPTRQFHQRLPLGGRYRRDRSRSASAMPRSARDWRKNWSIWLRFELGLAGRAQRREEFPG